MILDIMLNLFFSMLLNVFGEIHSEEEQKQKEKGGASRSLSKSLSRLKESASSIFGFLKKPDEESKTKATEEVEMDDMATASAPTSAGVSVTAAVEVLKLGETDDEDVNDINQREMDPTAKSFFILGPKNKVHNEIFSLFVACAN